MAGAFSSAVGGSAVIASDAPTAGSLDLPRWTTPSFRRTPGAYPLGVEAVAFSQLGQVASGLPVLSRHPRYWSLYTYAVKRFWDTGRTPQNNVALGRFVRPHEVVFATAALLCDRHEELPSIIGRDTFVPWLNQHPDGDLPLDLNYLQQSLGGYGQVYRGAMGDLGLILLADNNPTVRLDAPFGDVGKALADAFEAAIAGTTWARQYRDQVEGTIPLGVVRELAQASCFCRLKDSATERDLLIKVLLGEVQPPSESHRARADTVRMFIDLAAATDGAALSEERFWKLTTFGADGDGGVWQPRANVQAIHRRWQVVCLRRLVNGVLNGMLVHLVRWGLEHGGTVRSLDLRDYGEAISRMTLPVAIGLGDACAGGIGLRKVAEGVHAAVWSQGWPPVAGAVSEPLGEPALRDLLDRGRHEAAPVIGLLLLLLARERLRHLAEHVELSTAELRMLAESGDDRVGISELFAWLDDKVACDQDVADAAFELIRLRIIRQHLRIARGKLPEDTFRFRQEGGGLIFFDQGDRNGLNPVSMRFEAIGSALAELGLLEATLDQATHAPTERGLQVLDG